MKNKLPTLDITDIPRYAASMPMQTRFVTNADSSGDHIFDQIDRKGNVAVYRRTNVKTGRVMGYEVIKIKVVKAGTVFGEGAVPTAGDTESYPGAESFGFNAWSYSSPVSAMNKFHTKCQEAVTIVPPAPTTSLQIPTGLFNLKQFAVANNLPLTKDTAGVLTGLLSSKICRFVKAEQVDNRSIQLFARV